MGKKLNNKIIVAIIGVLFFTFYAGAAEFKIKQLHPFDSEIKTLPEYCYVKFKYGQQRKNNLVRKWEKLFKGNYVHIHHY